MGRKPIQGQLLDKIPSGEKIEILFRKENGTEYYITSNQDRSWFFMYEIIGTEFKRVGKENNPNKLLPNANMASAHGEIGAMQQLVNVGKAKNANIIIDVKGKDVCGFCRGDIAAMAEKSGANSVLIHANRDKTGAPVTYYWKPGMKSVKEVKK